MMIIRPHIITSGSDHFCDLDAGVTQEFELFLSDFSRNDVFCLEVVSIPINAHNGRSVDEKSVEQLEVILRSSESVTTYLPSHHLGVYEFVLTSSHGLYPGRYTLTTKNTGSSTHSIRVHMSISPYLAARGVLSGETVSVVDDRSEWSFFRYFHQDPSKLISVRVYPKAG
jgi:hypothetical protein